MTINCGERNKIEKNAGLPKANSPSDSCILTILSEIQCILHTGLELKIVLISN